jgi:hypothetical protein
VRSAEDNYLSVIRVINNLVWYRSCRLRNCLSGMTPVIIWQARFFKEICYVLKIKF